MTTKAMYLPPVYYLEGGELRRFIIPPYQCSFRVDFDLVLRGRLQRTNTGAQWYWSEYGFRLPTWSRKNPRLSLLLRAPVIVTVHGYNMRGLAIEEQPELKAVVLAGLEAGPAFTLEFNEYVDLSRKEDRVRLCDFVEQECEKLGEIRQGSLVVERRALNPNLFELEEELDRAFGVETFAAPIQRWLDLIQTRNKPLRFFNHGVYPPMMLCGADNVRLVIPSGPLVISSPDHPDEPIVEEDTAGKLYYMYHYVPRRDVD